jgi:N6-adenosine-specific RNA methylase IME4
VTFDTLNPPYSTIVADPPWAYDEVDMPYSTMTVDEIAALPVVDLAERGTRLYLWTTNRHLWASRDIVLGWGFVPSQVLVWCKPPGPRTQAGVFAMTHEFVIVSRRPSMSKPRIVPRAGAMIRQAREAAGLGRSDLHRLVRGGTPTGIVYRWEDDSSMPNATDWSKLQEVLPALALEEQPPVQPPPEREPVKLTRVDRSWWEWPRSGHSAKPSAFLDLVETVSPGPYVELFARQPRLGWDAWGHGYEIGAAS